MMRRCAETGFNKFAMCSYVHGAGQPFAEVGTMLTIQELATLPDGRMLVETIGYRRYG
jgi:Lon protease-like protein